MMTGAYFGMVTDERWFSKAESFEDGPTAKLMTEAARETTSYLLLVFRA
jgi:hypothetical protein